ncbi:MAG TPA: hypothetical protein VFL83_11325 [Anaeromyxobacter sp.]|nr:hypothetical protein [Anaeromyxobacter sp.]
MANRTCWAVASVVVAFGGSYPRIASADSGQGSTPLADDRTLVALAVALACADAPEAEPLAPAPPATAPADEGPELELVATVRAKALKFDVVPRTQVVFQGTGKRKTVWKTERVNLPMRPEPGVVYRDVAVRLTVTSNVEELGALLREAKHASEGIVMEQAEKASAPASATKASPAPGAPASSTPPSPAASQAASPAAPAPSAPAAAPAQAAPHAN